MVRSNLEETAVAEVAVNAPLRKLFHYRVPPDLVDCLQRGHRVVIPFGHQTTTGVCVGFPDTAQVKELKPIREILHPESRFDAHLLELTRWMADYYHTPWGEVLEAAMPPAIRAARKERGVKTVKALLDPGELTRAAEKLSRRAPVRARLLELLASAPEPLLLSTLADTLGANQKSIQSALRALEKDGFLARGEGAPERRDPFADELVAGEGTVGAREPVLTPEQEEALQSIRAAMATESFSPILLHGVTGSGKTEIYIRALKEAAKLGGSGLVLVPEIALTPQTVRMFRTALPDQKVSILHSMLSPRERAAQWRDIEEGKSQVTIGARSAVFAPVSNLRIIIVDEEHEASYKQDTSPRYHARDVAVMRARLLGIPVVLGSATPSMESYYNSESGKYRRLNLRRRVTPHNLPAVKVVELGPEFYHPDGRGLISNPLDRLIRSRLESREQVLLFLNRRGFSTFLHCLRCGFILKCSDCDIALTYHRQRGVAQCHLCDARRSLPGNCPDCGVPGLRRSGAGTEKIIDHISRRYPHARTARLDSDAVSSHRKLREVLDRFSRREIDILVGTQMIAKGHDFPGVSLVGIISADTGLHLPDFRAGEKTFAIITQVAGRAGRGESPGQVVIQTFFPDHYALRHAVAGDYCGFYREELGYRRALGYPPFGRTVKVMVQGEDEERVRKAAEAAGRALRSAGGAGVVLGPAESPIARIQGRYRMQILLKGKTRNGLQAMLAALPSRTTSGTDLMVDVDPQSLL